MKKGLLLASFLMIIIAAKCDNQSVGDFFNRPVFDQCILLEDPRLMTCNGMLVPTKPGQILMRSFDAEDEMTEYYMDKEERLYSCLKFGVKYCK